MSFFTVYVTAKDEEEARKIANHLLEKRLIACANMFKIESIYRWKSAVENENEIAMIMKTQESNIQGIISEVKAVHSYEVPCVVSWPIADGNPDYLKWIKDETKPL